MCVIRRNTKAIEACQCQSSNDRCRRVTITHPLNSVDEGSSEWNQGSGNGRQERRWKGQIELTIEWNAPGQRADWLKDTITIGEHNPTMKMTTIADNMVKESQHLVKRW